MSSDLRVLVVEDSQEDTFLLIRKIEKGGFKPIWERVDNEAQMRVALLEKEWDFVISDYSMPDFDGLCALKLKQKIAPDLPFIMVSGTMGEDVAVKAMKEGAHDYLMKEDLGRLIPAIRRELGEAKIRRERLKALELLEEREEFLTAVVENIPHVIIVKDVINLRILRINRAGEDMLGMSRKELIGKSNYDLFSFKEAELLTQRECVALRGGSIVDIPEEVIKTRKKGERILHTKKIPIKNEDGEPLFLCSISEDITNKKRKEAQQVELKRQLRQAQKMESLGTLAGGIAHDFNNVLTAIIGYTDLAKSSVFRGSQAESQLERVLTASNRAKELVRQILTFSRQAEAEFISVEMHSVVQEALKLLRSSIPSSIEINEHLEPGIVMSDPTQIHQVVMNLCTNSYHSMVEEGGVLDISLTRVHVDGDQVATLPDLQCGPAMKLTISDTGHGMTEDVMARIFDPYYSTKEKGHGTGLGLSVVHGIVKSHRGAITVESSPGKGSQFSIYFPRIETKRTRDDSIDAEAMPTGNERILFVDDEAIIANLGEIILTNLGYDVVAKTDSTKALNLFLSDPQQFDLVITDMTMPKMTGKKLSREIIAARSDIPIILCTGFSESITESKAREIGIQALVHKPFTQKGLACLVRKLLD